jgi:hypothetical protein
MQIHWKLIVLAMSLSQLAGAESATSLKSFEGIEEPTIKYLVATNQFLPDSYINITDREPGVVRMTLRYHPGDWWDGDRDRHDTSRQRAEVKGIGPHQKENEAFEYCTTVRTDGDFKVGDRFCHIFQVKSTNGDAGAPLITLSLMKDHKAAVKHWSGDAKHSTVAREFDYKPGEWMTVKIRIKISHKQQGEVLVSVNGDEFKGTQNMDLYRPDATDYRPKWGLYRGTAKDMPFGDDWVEHKDASANKLTEKTVQ